MKLDKGKIIIIGFLGLVAFLIIFVIKEGGVLWSEFQLFFGKIQVSLKEVLSKITKRDRVSQSGHTECLKGVCVVVDGPGKNQCQFDANCLTEFHTECRKSGLLGAYKCVTVKEPGMNQCEVDGDCASGIPSYRQCKSGKCLEFFGKGYNVCNIDDDCRIKPPEKEK